jgi:hypothetical protein
MLSKDIPNLSVPDLCDLLVDNTNDLLHLLGQKPCNRWMIFHKNADVKLIQSAIEKNRRQREFSTSMLKVSDPKELEILDIA